MPKETRKGERQMNKRLKAIGKVLAGGFAASLFLIMMAIYFGYQHAYAAEVGSHEVKMFGLVIYHLVWNADKGKYIGTAVNTHMGIVSGVCMIAALMIAMAISRYRNAHSETNHERNDHL